MSTPINQFLTCKETLVDFLFVLMGKGLGGLGFFTVVCSESSHPEHTLE